MSHYLPGLIIVALGVWFVAQICSSAKEAEVLKRFMSAWRNWKTHREIASSDALAETKRVAPDVIAASEQAAQSNAGSSPAALAICLGAMEARR